MTLQCTSKYADEIYFQYTPTHVNMINDVCELLKVSDVSDVIDSEK